MNKLSAEQILAQLEKNRRTAHHKMDEILRETWFPNLRTMSLPDVVKSMKEMADAVAKEGITVNVPKQRDTL